MDPKVVQKANGVEVTLDEAVFPRPVGLAAAYRFIDRCYVLVETRPGKRLSVRLESKEPTAPAERKALAGEFRNELLHQLVRRQVAERTDGLRAAIVGRALLSADDALAAEASAPAAASDPLDFQDDPLGIAVPWEEKYGGKRENKPKKRSGQPKKR
ncbi:MAG: hypothetical protein GYA57_15280 [Myxococcales bacterium]|nr:hypothetical protein [Myxococcales bacterium]